MTKEITNEEERFLAALWREYCGGCQNMKCKNSWDEINKCRGKFRK